MLGLTACGSMDYKYVPPNLAAQSAAIVTGSRSRNPDPMTADTRVFLASIDGKLTLDGPRGWDDRTVVAPGTHVIRFAVARNQLFAYAQGLGQTQVTLEAGKTYVLRATDPVPVKTNCATAAGWIESEDGTPVSDKVPVMVATYTGGEIALPGGGFVTIPSQTNCPPP